MKNIIYLILAMIIASIFAVYLFFNSDLAFQHKNHFKFLKFVEYSSAQGSFISGLNFTSLNFYTPSEGDKNQSSQFFSNSFSIKIAQALLTLSGKGIFIDHINGSGGKINFGPEGRDRLQRFKESFPSQLQPLKTFSLKHLQLSNYELNNLPRLPGLKLKTLQINDLKLHRDKFSFNKVSLNSNAFDLFINKPKEIFLREDEFSFEGVLKPTYFQSLIKPTLLEGNVFIANRKPEYEVFFFSKSFRLLFDEEGLNEINIDELQTKEYIKSIFPLQNIKMKIKRNQETGEYETRNGEFFVGETKFTFLKGKPLSVNGDLYFPAKAKILDNIIEARIVPFKFNQMFRYSVKLSSPNKLNQLEILSLIVFNKKFDEIDLNQIAILNKMKLLLEI